MKSETIASLEELQNLARQFLKDHPKGIAVGLCGDLGAGKTAFVKKCVAELDPTVQVTSPSFVIHVRYDIQSTPIEHFDFYRLDKLDEKSLSELGYFDALARARESRGFVFVEWPERAPRELLDLDLVLTLSLNPNGTRTIEFT